MASKVRLLLQYICILAQMYDYSMKEGTLEFRDILGIFPDKKAYLSTLKLDLFLSSKKKYLKTPLYKKDIQIKVIHISVDVSI